MFYIYYDWEVNMNIYDLISRAQKLRKETQLDSVSPDRVGGLQEDTLKYINEFQLLASSPSLHKLYASVSAMQSDKSPKSDLTGKPLKPGQLVVIVPADQSDATAGDVYRYDGPSGNTSAWTFVAKIGAVPADAELSATSTNPPQNKVVTEKLTELESDVFKSTTEIDIPSSRLDNCYINTEGQKVAVNATDADWYVEVYKTNAGAKYDISGRFIVATMALAVFADAECTQLIKMVHNSGVNINAKYIGDGNYLAVPCWSQGASAFIPIVTKSEVEIDTLNPSIKVPYIDAELLGYSMEADVAFSSQSVKTAFSNLDIKKGNRFSLRFDSSLAWSQVAVFYGSEYSDSSRRLTNSAVNGETYEFVAKEDIKDIKVFLIAANDFNMTINAKLEGIGRVQSLEAQVESLSNIEKELEGITDEKENVNMVFSSMSVQTPFSNLGIKAGEKFSLTLSSASSWSQVAVFYGSEYSDHTRRLINSAVNGQTYEFTAPEDINDIKVFLISANDFNMTISAKYEKFGRLSEVEKAVEDIVTSRSAILPYLSNKADALAAGSSLAISSAPNTKNHHVIGCSMAITEMGRIRISHGLDTYAFGMVEIDETNVYEYINGNTTTPAYTNPHGLNIQDFINVAIRVNAEYAKADLIITSLTANVTKSIDWRGCTGQAILTAVSGSYTDVKLTMGGNAYKKEVWICGDSYADYWLPILYRKGVTDFHADAFSGRNSVAALISLQNALKLGTPKVLVWMLGMNDGDGSAINTSYKSVFDSVKSICKNMGIAFVPCTIPNCPVVNNYHKNAYVRANSEHYIDMARILGADYTDSTWYDGLMAADNVHPSEIGKFVVANAILASGVL